MIVRLYLDKAWNVLYMNIIGSGHEDKIEKYITALIFIKDKKLRKEILR